MTAVEKLELTLLGIVSFDSEELRTKYKERIAQAKENEKEQMIKFTKDYCGGSYKKIEEYYNASMK
jgi:hypothetical protein